MSVRLEWTTAEYAKPTLHKHGEELADGNFVTHEHGLVIGLQVVEGDRDELLRRLEEARKLLDPDAMNRARAVAQWEIGDPSWAEKIVAAFLDPEDLLASECIAEIEDSA